MADVEQLLANLPPEYIGWMVERYMERGGCTREEGEMHARNMIECVDDLDALGEDRDGARLIADEDMSYWEG